MQIKHEAEDFGGFQLSNLPYKDVSKILCARRFCGAHAAIQIMIPLEKPKMYRALCPKHFVLLCVVQSAAMGDPSPIGEGKRIADKLGIEWNSGWDLNSPALIDPEYVICSHCGGGMIGETGGAFKGKRWVHTCIETE